MLVPARWYWWYHKFTIQNLQRAETNYNGRSPRVEVNNHNIQFFPKLKPTRLKGNEYLPASTLSIPLFDADLGKVWIFQRMSIGQCASSKMSLLKLWWGEGIERWKDPYCSSVQKKKQQINIYKSKNLAYCAHEQVIMWV